MHSVKVTIFSSESVLRGNISLKKPSWVLRPDPDRWWHLVTKIREEKNPLYLNKCLKDNKVRKVIFIPVAYLPSAWDEYGENKCFGVGYFYAHNVSVPEG